MSRAVIILASRAERERAAKWCLTAPVNTRVEFKKARRSVDQNALLWSRLTELAQQVVWYGQKLTPEDWKDIMTASLRQARVVPGIDAGSFVPLGMRTSDMTVAEMGELLDLIDAFGAQQGVTFSDQGKGAGGANNPVREAVG